MWSTHISIDWAYCGKEKEVQLDWWANASYGTKNGRGGIFKLHCFRPMNVIIMNRVMDFLFITDGCMNVFIMLINNECIFLLLRMYELCWLLLNGHVGWNWHGHHRMTVFIMNIFKWMELNGYFSMDGIEGLFFEWMVLFSVSLEFIIFGT